MAAIRLTVLFSKRSRVAKPFCDIRGSRDSSRTACASATDMGWPHGVWSGLCNPRLRMSATISSWKETACGTSSLRLVREDNSCRLQLSPSNRQATNLVVLTGVDTVA